MCLQDPQRDSSVRLPGLGLTHEPAKPDAHGRPSYWVSTFAPLVLRSDRRQEFDHMTGHPLDAAIIQAIDNVIKREIAEADEVREEIKRGGTHRASDEIWKLRWQVAALRKRLAEYAVVAPWTSY